MGKWLWILVISISLCGCASEKISDQAATAGSPTDDPPPVTVTANKNSAPPRATIAFENRPTPTHSPGRIPPRQTTGPQVAIHGKVVYEDGSPVSLSHTTVTVQLRHHPEDKSQPETLLDSSLLDPQGNYSVTGPDGPDRQIHVVGISCPIADLRAPSTLTTATTVRRLNQDFLIPVTHTISGNIIDGNGHPVPAATVSFRSDDVKTDGWYYGNQITTTTSTGHFHLQHVAAGTSIIGANAPGYGTVTEKITVPTSGPVTFRLTTGTATLQGTLTLFPSDSPLPNAHISITPAGDASTLNLDTLPPKTAQTASDGSFMIPGLSAGTHRISVKSATGQSLYPAPRQSSTFQLMDNETTAPTIRVFPGYQIQGLVYDKETSEPISAAEVTLHRGNTAIQKATTSPGGEFHFNNVPPDQSAQIAVAAKGFIIEMDHGHPIPRQGIRYGLKFPAHTDQARIEIPMIGSVTVSGRVITSQETPVPNAEIQWVSGSRQYENLFTTITNSDGYFSLELLPFDNGLIEATASGYAPKLSDSIRTTSTGKDDVLIVLENGASARGRVVGSDGTGISGAVIFIQDTIVTGFTHHTRFRSLVTTALDGSFVLADLPPDTDITLSASARGYARGEAKVNIASGEEQTGVLIRLLEELTIEGRVLGPDDEPVSAAINSFDYNQWVRTDAEGNFRLNGLPRGEVSLRVLPDSPYTFKEIFAEAGTKDLIIRVEGDQITAHCTVVDDITKRPVTDFKVANVSSVRRKGPGQFSISMGRNYILQPRISAEGYITKTFSVSAEGHSSDFEVTLEMGRGSGVEGRIVNGEGEPLSNIPVAAFEDEVRGMIMFGSTPPPLSNTISAADGTFVIAGIQSGQVRVTAMPDPPTPHVSKTASLVSGKIEDLGDFILGETGTITGRVIRLSSQQPVPGTTIHIGATIDNSFFNESVTTDDQGRFSVTDLSPATYSVGIGGSSRTVEVGPSQVAEVNFELGDATLSGRITRGGTNAQVSIVATSVQTGEIFRFGVSVEKGTYTLRNLKPGDYTIQITPYSLMGQPSPAHMEGFKSYTDTVTITDDPNQTRDYILP